MLKIWAIVILGFLLAIFSIFTPAETEVNLAIFALYSLVIVGPAALAVMRDGLRVGKIIEVNEQVVALVTSGIVLALLQTLTLAPAEIKLGLVSLIGSLVIVPPVALGLAKALGPKV